MRWNNNTLGFVLRRMSQIVSDGSRTGKCIKDKDVNSVAKALREYSGEAVSPTQVYNHLRKWRQKWARGHPKDAEFLNTPIRFYTEMENIFSSAMATGRYALGSSEPLGVHQADSVAANIEGHGFISVADVKTSTMVGEGSKASELLTSIAGPKRKRANFSGDEMLMMTDTTYVVNNVANTLRETRPTHVDPALYLAVMEMQGFTEEALIVAYTYLLDNKALGRGFVNMVDSHRDIWLRNYLAKNYYM
ncbi:unnamed protein product [Miscanthus lutarioriparius]|uniref:Myb/SANT-like domain-containing protein n=1 Tax=Miscanthus lutarioriparius TaxID=422564 RepID=A0A811RTP2_9POAL|nr:unnamed protein product [Miscanthus lutarioriparius]